MSDFAKRIEITNRENSFMIYNGMKLTEMSEDFARVELNVLPSSKNLFGAIHGGVFFTMSDCAAGAAARSGGMRYVTLSNSFEFFRNTKSEQIRAEGFVRHRGRTICIVQVDVKDETDSVLASGTFTMFCTGKLDE